MLKFTVGGEPVEIWFTPSFNIKTTSEELAQQLRSIELRAFDPWRTQMRKLKVTQGEREAYILLVELNEKLPELKITFSEFPKLPEHPIDEQKELLY